MKGLTDDEINLKILRETRLNLLDERDGLRAKIARLTRELDEARGEIKRNKELFERFSNDMANLCTESITARAHFRRACELLDKYSWRPGEHKSAEEWMAEVERLEGNP